MRKLTFELYSEIIIRWDNGESLRSICKEYKINYISAHKQFKKRIKNKEEYFRNYLDINHLDKVKRVKVLKDKGLKVYEIISLTNFSKSFIADIYYNRTFQNILPDKIYEEYDNIYKETIIKKSIKVYKNNIVPTFNIEKYGNCGIYKIKNKLNNRIYIGQSRCIKTRWQDHILNLCNKTHHSKALQNFVNKYGIGNISFEIIHNCHIDDLNKYEQFYLDTLLKANENNSKFFRLGYNSVRTAEGKKIISKKLKPQDIIKIANMSNRGVLQKDIAQKFSVSPITISNIKSGKNWSYLNHYFK